MNHCRKMLVMLLLVAVVIPDDYSFAGEFIIYPGKGQSSEQMEKDKYECYQWAKQQSGFDPMAPPQAPARVLSCSVKVFSRNDQRLIRL